MGNFPNCSLTIKITAVEDQHMEVRIGRTTFGIARLDSGRYIVVDGRGELYVDQAFKNYMKALFYLINSKVPRTGGGWKARRQLQLNDAVRRGTTLSTEGN